MPSWADDLAIGNRMINARGETVQEKPTFRRLMASQRCLVPATGFYEWKKTSKVKQPYLFTLTGSEVFGMAGLWDRWTGSGDQIIESYTILTTRPNEVAGASHDRMPVIIAPADYETWLDATASLAQVNDLIKPFDGEPMTVTPVSTLVNSPANDKPECIEHRHSASG